MVHFIVFSTEVVGLERKINVILIWQDKQNTRINLDLTVDVEVIPIENRSKRSSFSL